VGHPRRRRPRTVRRSRAILRRPGGEPAAIVVAQERQQRTLVAQQAENEDRLSVDLGQQDLERLEDSVGGCVEIVEDQQESGVGRRYALEGG
jgi:hypothetical protein